MFFKEVLQEMQRSGIHTNHTSYFKTKSERSTQSHKFKQEFRRRLCRAWETCVNDI